MFRRRFAQHLKKQDWSTIVIELVVLVVGVFLGLQAANWNEARIEREQARDLRERLTEDFTDIVASLDGRLSRLEVSIAAANELHRLLRARTVAADDPAIIDRINKAWSTSISVPPSATFSEMLSTGDTRLLQNPALRSALFDYHQAAIESAQLTSTLTPHFLESTLPLESHVVVNDQNDGVTRYDPDGLADNAVSFRVIVSVNSNMLTVYGRQAEQARRVLGMLTEA